MTQSDIAVIVGWMASICGLFMWLTLVHQIKLNLQGQKGSWVVACAVVCNCALWVSYGFVKVPHELFVAIANIPGLVLGLVAATTSAPESIVRETKKRVEE